MVKRRKRALVDRPHQRALDGIPGRTCSDESGQLSGRERPTTAASRLICSPWTSPAQWFACASLRRSRRCVTIPASRSRSRGSTRAPDIGCRRARAGMEHRRAAHRCQGRPSAARSAAGTPAIPVRSVPGTRWWAAATYGGQGRHGRHAREAARRSRPGEDHLARARIARTLGLTIPQPAIAPSHQLLPRRPTGPRPRSQCACWRPPARFPLDALLAAVRGRADSPPCPS